MAYNVLPLTKLVEQFERLPGIGRKTAQRLAFYVLSLPKELPDLSELDRKGAVPHLLGCFPGSIGDLCGGELPGCDRL